MNLKKFTGEEGKLISAKEATTIINRFHEKKKKEGSKPKTYTEAQFFGNKQLAKLMQKEGCVGLRFYFGVSEDTEFSDHIVVVAVNEDGKDLTSTRIGLKDMPEDRGDALTGGPVCPHSCNP
ncbi:hypothetical protein [Arundinibacter roseus]|uniref:Uncharacterized protein n=1 Tax=Arundinibacter roseus TaxID=2070510 RepID=A0A4R4KMF0_9BACT|nr:hypothetical protein [Arundinibacter roseus]TDB67839.1 hypothetical protein EZE20_02640 [Arundinibacter roseus]